MEFLDSELHLPELPPADEASLSRVGKGVIIKRRERLAKLRNQRAQTAKASERANLDPPARRNRGWRCVPVCSLADYDGPKHTAKLRDWLKLDSVAANMPALAFDEEFERAWDGRTGDFTCFLSDDWRFDEIAADARKRLGHEYSGDATSIAAIVVGAGYDVEAAFMRCHPNASSIAVAAFLQSWHIQRYFAEFCFELGRSTTAREIVGNQMSAAEQAALAHRYLCRKLMAIAHQLNVDDMPRAVLKPLRAVTRTQGDPATLAAQRSEFMAPHIAPTPRKPTISGLSQAIGIEQSSMSRWYRGLNSFSDENVGKLAERLNVKPSTVPN